MERKIGAEEKIDQVQMRQEPPEYQSDPRVGEQILRSLTGTSLQMNLYWHLNLAIIYMSASRLNLEPRTHQSDFSKSNRSKE
jgi:hypothetical protein